MTAYSNHLESKGEKPLKQTQKSKLTGWNIKKEHYAAARALADGITVEEAQQKIDKEKKDYEVRCAKVVAEIKKAYGHRCNANLSSGHLDKPATLCRECATHGGSHAGARCVVCKRSTAGDSNRTQVLMCQSCSTSTNCGRAPCAMCNRKLDGSNAAPSNNNTALVCYLCDQSNPKSGDDKGKIGKKCGMMRGVDVATFVSHGKMQANTVIPK